MNRMFIALFLGLAVTLSAQEAKDAKKTAPEAQKAAPLTKAEKKAAKKADAEKKAADAKAAAAKPAPAAPAPTPAKPAPAVAAKPAPAASAPKAVAASTAIVGNKDSKIYHRADCKMAGKMKDAHKVSFASAAEADKAGYKACKVCKP